MSMTEDEQRTADELDKIRDLATEAGGDLLEDIERLEMLAEKLRVDPALKRRYEALRDKVTKVLAESGPRYYLDANGVKRFAYAVVPEYLEMDVEQFVELHEAGRMPKVDLDKVLPRKPDLQQLRRSLAKDHIPSDVVSKTIKFRAKTGHTRFADPADDQ